MFPLELAEKFRREKQLKQVRETALNMQDMLTPLVATDLKDMILDAKDKGNSLEILGHGTKRAIGKYSEENIPLTMRRFSEVTLYEPSELVISARAGTPIAEIERELKSYNQHLPFEYLDFSKLFNTEPGYGTIGLFVRHEFFLARAAF